MRYTLKGLDCPNCARKIEDDLRKIKGLEAVTVNFNTQSIDLPPELAPVARKVIAGREPGVKLEEKGSSAENEEDGERRQLYLISLAALLLIAGFIFNKPLHATLFSWAEYTVLIPAYLLVGWQVISGAFKRLIRGELFDESFLMTVATVGAIAVHQLSEAAAVMLFYAVGEYFQERAVNRSKRSIVALLEIQPDYANLKTGAGIKEVRPEEVAVGESIIVKPGEKVPLDGEVTDGVSFLDTSALTGEPAPRKVEPGMKALAGMINGQGLLTVEVIKPFTESSVAKILAMVEEAAERKAPTEKFITAFARYYTPVVVVGAAVLALLPPLIIPGARFGDWVYRALILLVISCPCALMVSIPLGYFGGIGGASRQGILIKGANYLDALAKVKTVVFDKTGTLTKGVFRVTQIVPGDGFSEEDILGIAAAAEVYSNHPIAQSIRQACQKGVSKGEVSDYREIPGYGISASVAGKKVMVGNDRFLHRREVAHDTCDIKGTTVHIVIDDVYAGYLIISDETKNEAGTAVQRLKKLGIEQTVLLTGDEESAARCLAEELQLNRYYAGLLPAGKVQKLEELAAAGSGKDRAKLAFVGDGINDAPVITRADVGIAMGGLGSDAAIEAADVVLMEDNPAKVATAIEIARYTRRIVRQNILLALSVKLFFMTFGVAGVATIWEAVFADVGVTLAAVLNASRILQFKSKIG
ncbi:MAG: heavy metal translocating P-type ATPase [Bacillota bacterium]